MRPDGRGLHGFRRTTVALGEIGTADGSALVRIGETAVVAGIKAELANPPIERPDAGWLVPNVTIPRMSVRPPALHSMPSDTAQLLTLVQRWRVWMWCLCACVRL